MRKCACSITLALGILGQSAAADPLGAPAGEGGAPPLGVLGLINLSQAGVLESYFSNELYGTVEGRIGRSRAAYGVAEAPYGPQSGFKDSTVDSVPSLTVLKALPGGDSFLRFYAEGINSEGDGTHVDVDTDPRRVDLQYVRFLSPNRMLAFGPFYEHTHIKIADNGTVNVNGWGVRLDGIQKFNDHWALWARAEYLWARSKMSVSAGPAGELRHDQDDDHLYLQTELVGQYRKEDLSWLGGEMYLAPIFGAVFQRDFIEKTRDSFGVSSAGVTGSVEDYGTVWAKLRLGRMERPDVWLPQATIGIEHEFTNDLDDYMDETNFALIGLGLSRIWKSGHRIDLRYNDHIGFDDVRRNTSLAAAFTLVF